MGSFKTYFPAFPGILLLIIFPYNLHSFSKDTIQSRIALADSLYRTQQYQQTLYILEETLPDAINKLGEKDPLVARIYDDLGRINVALSSFTQAAEYHYKALHLRLELYGETHLDVATSYHGLGIVYWYRADHEKGYYYHTKSLHIREELLGENHPLVARSLTNTGVSLRDGGKYNEALSYFHRGLEIRKTLFGEEHPDIAESYNHIGVLYVRKGDYYQALEYYREALEIRIRTLGDKHPNVASSYNNVASQLQRSGDYGQSLHYHNRALAIRLEIYGEKSWFTGHTYGNMGHVLMMMERYSEAFIYFQKARDIYKTIVGENHPQFAIINNHLGNLYRRMGEYTKALDLKFDALDIFLTVYGEKHQNTSLLYHDIGHIYQKMKKYDEALRYFDKSIGIHSTIFGDSHPRTADLYIHFSCIYSEKENYDLALYHIDRALTILAPDYPDRMYGSEYIPAFVTQDLYFIHALNVRGDILHHKYLAYRTDDEILFEALGTFQVAVHHIENMRKKIISEESKRFRSEHDFELFENAIRTSLLLFEETDDDAYKKLAFEFAEKNRAAALREAVAESHARSFSAVSDSLLKREREFRWKIASHEVQFTRVKKDTEETRKLHDNLFAARESYNELIEYIEQKYTRYYELKYQTQTASVEDIINYLDDRTMVLKYFAGEENIYLFAITDDAFEIHTLPSADDIDGLADTLINSIRKVDPAGYIASGSALYDLLIKPVRHVIDTKSELVILPDGFLYTIPFEVLLDTSQDIEPGWRDFASLPYLIRDYSISYHYSATLLEKTSPGTIQLPQASFAGFAPVFANLEAEHTDALLRLSLNPLPYSEDEVKSLVSLMEGHGIPALGFYHTMANKENFLYNARQYSVVHIASHGIVDAHHSGLSGIVFASPDNPGQYETLYAREMYDLDLNANLIVIGSCKSGYGTVVRGEGLISMTHGLLYSGSPNIIVSLWEVYDRYSKDLMIEFYRSVLSGNSFAHSLRAAKLAIIENEATAFPNFWSSTVLIGR